jgi:Tfp pilus assembly protein PilN
MSVRQNKSSRDGHQNGDVKKDKQQTQQTEERTQKLRQAENKSNGIMESMETTKGT